MVQKRKQNFEITQHSGHPILGRDTCKETAYINYPKVLSQSSEEPTEHEVKAPMQQVKIPPVSTNSTSAVTIDGIIHHLPISEQYIWAQFGDVFDSLGELSGGELGSKYLEKSSRNALMLFSVKYRV